MAVLLLSLVLLLLLLQNERGLQVRRDWDKSLDRDVLFFLWGALHERADGRERLNTHQLQWRGSFVALLVVLGMWWRRVLRRGVLRRCMLVLGWGMQGRLTNNGCGGLRLASIVRVRSSLRLGQIGRILTDLGLGAFGLLEPLGVVLLLQQVVHGREPVERLARHAVWLKEKISSTHKRH